jgi:hypothetical protein
VDGSLERHQPLTPEHGTSGAAGFSAVKESEMLTFVSMTTLGIAPAQSFQRKPESRCLPLGCPRAEDGD